MGLLWSSYLKCNRGSSNSTAEVHPKYVKRWGVLNSNTPIAFFSGDAFKGRHQSMMEIFYLYSVKIDGGRGPQILSCKDGELIAEKVFS